MNNIRRDENESYQRRGGRRQEGRDDERQRFSGGMDYGPRGRDESDDERQSMGQEDWRSRDQYESSIGREDYRMGSRDRDEGRFGSQDPGYRGGVGGRQSGGYYDSSQSYQSSADQGRFGGERYYGQGGFDEDERQGYGRQGRMGREGGQFGREGGPFGREGYQTGQGNWNQGGYGQSGQGFGQGYGQSGQGFGRNTAAQERYGQERYGQSYGQQSFGRQDDFGTSQMGYGDQDYRQRAFGEQSGRSESRGGGFMQRMREFIGKGPKGFTRSDERIKEEVNERLSHGYLDASDIEVSVTSGEVTLEGTVRSKDDRRIAEDVIEGVLGVKDVDNKLKVKRETQSSSQQFGAQGAPGSSDTGASSGQRPGSTPAHKRS